MGLNRLCSISMLLAIIFLLYAGLGGHFAPAPLSTDPVEKVAQFYQQYGPQILVFAFFNCMATTLMLPAFCAVSDAMLSMKPRQSGLAMIQIVGGSVATIGPFLGSMFLAAAVIRPDNSPNVLATLTDLAVVFIELSTLPALFQGTSIFAAIAADRSLVPLLPRWYGWISLIWGIMAQGGLFAIFYETGPLSSTGVIGIVLPMVSLFVWMAATALVLFRMKPHHLDV